MDIPAERPLSGAVFIRQFFPSSSYVAHLGMQLSDIQPGTETLTLPFADPLITVGTIVHGGAIASLIDTAAMVAAWSCRGPRESSWYDCQSQHFATK